MPYLLVLLLLLCVPSLSADPVSQARDRSLEESLLGRWVALGDGAKLSLRFQAGGRCHIGEISGTCSVREARLHFTHGDTTYRYNVQLDMQGLTLSGEGLSQPLKLSTQTDLSDALAAINPANWVGKNWRLKLQRLVSVILIVIAARVFIALLSAASRWTIETNWGPLAKVYRTDKRRHRTLHSIGLNIIKYVVYFAALGFILSELGVNYTAYIASLSVVGLAVGFGAQGLVQDLVTGFFVLLEGQFGVGDLIETSGQVGIVEDFGPRMTRLRNFAGQTVFIPNRSISVLSTYRKGSLAARVDVAIETQSAEEPAAKLLQQLGDSMEKQFPGVFFITQKAARLLALESGERFLRLEAALWPGQQWMVDAQLVPRIKEAFKRESILIPSERVVVTYNEGGVRLGRRS